MSLSDCGNHPQLWFNLWLRFTTLLWVELFTAVTRPLVDHRVEAFTCSGSSTAFHLPGLVDIAPMPHRALFVPSLTTHVFSRAHLTHRLQRLKDSDITQMVLHIEQSLKIENGGSVGHDSYEVLSFHEFLKVTFWEKNYIFEIEYLIKAPSPNQLKKEILMDEKVSSESPEWSEELVELERY